MEEIFKTALLLSAFGAAATLLLLLLKPVTGRLFGHTWQYYIWGVVLLVMVLPVRVSVPVKKVEQQAAMPLQNGIMQQENAAKGNVTTQQADLVPAAQQETATEYTRMQPGGIVRAAAYIWILGAIIFLSCGLISYKRFLRLIRLNAEPEGEVMGIQIKRTPSLNAPLLTGLFRPVLLLPEMALTDAEKDFVLQHELTHFRRRDLWYKWFTFFVNAVHWFNPFVYLAVRQINTECEISCDLTVTKNMSKEQQRGYMNTIIRLAAAKKGGM